MAETKIEWADRVWNPVTGCTPISEGCTYCYAKRMATRLKGRFGYPEDEPFRVTFHPDRLDQPLKWKKPRRIFVPSMGDLFHKDVRYGAIRDVFDIIEHCSWHTFLVLTKRPLRMGHSIKTWFADIIPDNLWLGISAENQQTLDERASILLQIPAAKRFVSLEPMLGPVDLTPYISKLTVGYRNKDNTKTIYDNYPVLDWVIIGGLSLPGGKVQTPDPQWIDDIVEQCDNSEIPIFIKENAGYYRHREEFPV